MNFLFKVRSLNIFSNKFNKLSFALLRLKWISLRVKPVKRINKSIYLHCHTIEIEAQSQFAQLSPRTGSGTLPFFLSHLSINHIWQLSCFNYAVKVGDCRRLARCALLRHPRCQAHSSACRMTKPQKL